VRAFVIVLAVGTAVQASEPPCAKNVGRVAALRGAPQRNALRSLLSGNFLEEHESLGCVFYYGDRLLPPLRALLRDPKFREPALALLFFIGDPNVMPLVLVSPSHDSSDNRWAYDVVCMMVAAASDEDWSFLRKAALNEFNDRWVDYGAIQTLKLIASPRSREILEEARRRNPERATVVAAALDYIRSNPRPLSDENLEELAKRTAEVVRIGKWEGSGQPQYNESRDKALVDFLFVTGSDQLTYTATFLKVTGVWRLRGVRETMQAYIPPLLILPAQQSILLPPPDIPFDRPLIPPLFPLLQPKIPRLAAPPEPHSQR